MSGFRKPNWALWLEPGERTLWEGAPTRPAEGRLVVAGGVAATVFAAGLAASGLAGAALKLGGLAAGAAVLWAALTPRAGLLTNRRALAAERRWGRWRIVDRRAAAEAGPLRREGTRVRLGAGRGLALEAGSEAEAARLEALLAAARDEARAG